MNKLTPPVRMTFSGGAIAQNWFRWEREFRTFFAGCELGQKPNETHVAILLHTAGPEAQEIHQTPVYANDDDMIDYNVVLGTLRAYCEPRKKKLCSRDIGSGHVTNWKMKLHDKRQYCIRNAR